LKGKEKKEKKKEEKEKKKGKTHGIGMDGDDGGIKGWTCGEHSDSNISHAKVGPSDPRP